jgi:uncharacterized protein (TIGR03083 family)
MTTLADRTIATLRAGHDTVAALVPDLSDEQLRGPSGAAEWPLAQVLSHLGSGAEIGIAGLAATVDGKPVPGQEFNQQVWDRWNAMTPEEQAAAFVEYDERLVAAYEALTADQRATLRVDLGFLPEPLPLAAVAGMRANESVLHSWDVRVALDPDAVLAEDAAEVLAEHLAGDLGFLLGFTAKADALAAPATVQIKGRDLGIVIADKVGLSTAVTASTATFVGPLEAVIRLVAGRLTPAHTPKDVRVEGAVTLDDLRRVFPGY